MWKTRFEMSTNINHNSIRQRNLLSSSSIKHHYPSNSTPSVPRVRENSPKTTVRSSSSSVPHLECVFEEEIDEDNQCSNVIDIELKNLQTKSPRQSNSSNKYQTVLPTIIESNDSEMFPDNEQSNSIVNWKINQTKELTLDQRIKEILQRKTKVREIMLALATSS